MKYHNQNRRRLFTYLSAHWKQVFAVSLTLTLVCVGIWFTAFSQYLKITTIRIETDNAILKKRLSAVVTNALDGRFLFFIPTDNQVFISKKSIENRVGEVTSLPVAIRKNLPHELIVTPDSEQILAVGLRGSQAFLLDNQGRAIVATELTEATDYHMILITTPNEVHLGDTILSTRAAEAIKKIIGLNGDSTYKAVYPTHLSYDTQDPETLGILTEKGVTIRISALRGVQEQLLSASAALQNLDRSQYSTSYVDVRVEGKAYIKSF